MAAFDSFENSPVGAYQSIQNANARNSLSKVQEVAGVNALAGSLRQRQQEDQIRQVLAESGGDMSAALPKLIAAGPLGVAAASHLVTIAQHQATTAKIAADAKRIADLQNVNPNDLDALEKSAIGHPYEAAILRVVDQRRKAQADAATLQGMKSRPATPAVPAAADLGVPQLIAPVSPQAETMVPQVAGPGAAVPVGGQAQPAQSAQAGAVPQYLLDSPHVGGAAKALQDRINAGGQGQNALLINAAIDRLNAQHTTQEGLKNRQHDALVNKIIVQDNRPAGRGAGGNAFGAQQGALDPVNDKEAIRDLAVQSLYDPNSLSGFRRDTKVMGHIQREKIQVMKEAGITSEDVVSGRAGFKADMASLAKITPQYDAVTAFEKTAIRNGDALVALADKVDATGVPVVEKWIRAGRKATGDADVAKFDAQLFIYRAEAAKILTNPNLSGQLTDSARHEVEEFLKPGASAQQIKGVVGLLKNDFENRKTTMEEQIGSIRARMRGRVSPGGQGASPTAAPVSAGVAPTTNAKGWTLHTDAQGNKAYVSPDGKQFEEAR